MTYDFRAAEQFWKSFHALPDRQKEATREAWQVFKLDPFDPRLRTHKIHSLSALYKRTIYSVAVESDLRVVFFIEGNTIFTVDIGTHDIYRV
jgi:mRNA-degrading endonuclease YafQ of YafQ-DinJ toxin-antitoxin module